MLKAAVTFLLAMSCLFVNAQKNQLSGRINDSTEKKYLRWASVSLIKKSDSTLVTFTRTNEKGEFSLQNLDTGKYVLLITYPHFADYMDDLNLTGDLDMGQVTLTPASKLLDAVIIRANGAIRIKGDTTEFVADSFKVKDGATVEDLLKKLPGLSVNSKGEITAQGKRVDKVLVDGEEFFGDDPTMATKNISSKAVDKVQVFDTKTDQQKITGITTGTEGKTVNIKLKESAKKGWFAKAEAGTDFHKYYDSKAYYNNFKGKKKISFYGTHSNVNTGSLNWQDRQKLGMDDNMQFDEIGGFYYSFSSGDDFSDWGSRGLPQSWTGGALYSNKWGNLDRNNVNLSYRYNRLLTIGTGTTYTQNILPSGVTYNNKYTTKNSLLQQHALNGKYEWKLDSLSTLKFTASQTYKTGSSRGTNNGEFLNSQLDTVNQSFNTTFNDTKKNQGDYALMHTQLFKKKGRQLVTTLKFASVDDDNSGFNITRLNYFSGGSFNYSDTVDQKKTFVGHSNTIGIKTSWVEPLNNKWQMILDYAFNQNHARSLRNTFDRDNLGKYEELVSTLSNNFKMDAISTGGTASFRYMNKKIKMLFGTGISTVELKLNNLDNGIKNNYHFFNVTPQANIGFTPKPQSNIGINYRGNTVQPNIQQLQPLRDNTDVLNEYIGNPDLKVGFTHSINLNVNSYKVLTNIWKSMNFSYQIQQNAITQYNTVDVNTGKRTYYPVNVNGNRSWYFWSNLDRNGGGKKPNLSARLSGNGQHFQNFVNGQKALTRSYSVTTELGFGYDKEDKYDFNINPRVAYNSSKSSLSTSINNNYWSYGGEVNINFETFWGVEFDSNFDFDLRQKLEAFPTNTNLIIWNGGLEKKIMKKTATIRLLARDILNQNKGFTRNISSTFVSDDRFQRIGRYFMLKLEWNFTKKIEGEKK